MAEQLQNLARTAVVLGVEQVGDAHALSVVIIAFLPTSKSGLALGAGDGAGHSGLEDHAIVGAGAAGTQYQQGQRQQQGQLGRFYKIFHFR